MAHYALIDENNIVVNVIPGCDESEEYDWEKIYEESTGLRCKRTSYNTFGGTHIGGGSPFRMNYASVGGTYDEEKDAFIPPKPYDSWTLDESTCLWKPPIPLPEVDLDYLDVGITSNNYFWDEETLNWIRALDTTP